MGLTRITTSLRRLPTQIPLLGHTCFLSCIYKPHILRYFYTFTWRSVTNVDSWQYQISYIKWQIWGMYMPLLLSNIKYQVCPCCCQISVMPQLLSNTRYAPALLKYQISCMPKLLSIIKYQVCPMLLSNIKYAPALVSRHKTWRDSATSGSSLTPEFPTKTKLTKSNFHEDIVYGL